VVVAAAIVVRSPGPARVLAAQRSRPPELAGRWELPGGKVEPGEPEVDAIARECREELGVEVRVGPRIGADLPIGDGRVLRVYLADLVRGEPQPHDHAALRWLTAQELEQVDWLDADRPLLPDLREVLTAANGRMSG
jgi:8-oxo-dGTP diphosphatase